jgi:prolipoprotein diacylglyceryltransferase
MLQVLWRIPIKTTWTPDGLPIYGFGMMLFLAFLLCTWLAARRAERVGIGKEVIQDLAIWLFIGGLLGARITYLLQARPASVVDFLSQLPKIWDGGIILYGSVLGGLAGYALAYALVFRKYSLSTLKLADVIAPSIAVGLCLGRMGCFLNGCCYGQVACADCPVYAVHFPLSAPARESLVHQGYQTVAGFTYAGPQPPDAEGVKVGQVDPASDAHAAGLRAGDTITEVEGRSVTSPADLNNYLGSLHDWPRGQTTVELGWRSEEGGESVTRTLRPRTLGLYPTQLYEVVSMFLLFLVLMAYYPLRHHDGQVMAVLMVGYGIHRYLNEILRDDPRPKGFEQYTSVLLVVLGVVLWLWLWRRPVQSAAAPVPAPSPA